MKRSEIANLIDHTLLKPESTAADVAALVAEGRRLGVKAVCVSPNMLPLADTGDLEAVTRRVNGGLTGLADRRQFYAAALAYLGSA